MIKNRYSKIQSEWARIRNSCTKEEFQNWRKEKHKANLRSRYKKNKKYINEYKIKNPCQICGEDNIHCIEFHHKNEEEKDFNIYSVGKSCSIKKLQKEINKCIVVCKNCHIKIHYEEMGTDHMKIGILESLILQIETTLKGDLTTKERKKLYKKKQSYQAKIYARDFRNNNKCKFCPEDNGICLIFHHKDGSDKKDNISRLYKYGIKAVKAEIEKCDLVCHNCHSIIHNSE